MRRLVNRKGQSTLEYVTVVTAIVAGIVLAEPTIKSKVQNAYEHLAAGIEKQILKITH